MNQNPERATRARPAITASLRRFALAAALAWALPAAHPALAQASGDLQQQAEDAAYKLNYLAEMSKLTNDQALQRWLEQQMADLMRDLQSLAEQAYRRCEAMKHPNKGNDGEIYKLAEMEKHRREAIQSLSGISRIFGGVPDAGATMASIPGKAALGAAKSNSIKIAKGLAEGTRLSGLFNKLGPSLAALNGGAQLYDTWKAVRVGIEAIEKRDAADAALTECQKPLPVRPPAEGTPELRPFMPDSPPPAPDNRPPPTSKEGPPAPPEEPITLREFLRKALAASPHAE